jgi:hypothetical protein
MSPPGYGEPPHILLPIRLARCREEGTTGAGGGEPARRCYDG